MASNMIVVADSARARIFTAETSKSPLSEIDVLARPEVRLHDRDLTSDLPGKDIGGDGSGAHAYQSKTDPKKHQQIEFSRQVARYLNDADHHHKLSKLLIVATPSFLGDLRSQLSHETSKKVVFELDKDLTQHSVDEIRSHLPKTWSH
ncbi:MAG: host attachment protein [Gammaproteobacteria bacterium]|nr:host attachment protein [Gammaproteobacteria bacterium]